MSPDLPNDSDIDQALKSGLSALAPEVDGGDALMSLRPRFRRARTRNRVAKVGGTVAALVAIVSVAALAAPSSGRTHVRVSSPPSTAPDHTSRPTKHSTTTSTTISLPVVTGPAPTVASTVPHQPGPSGSSPTTAVTVPGTTPGTAPHGDDNGKGDGGGQGGPSSPTTNPWQNGVRTYRSPGGSITVRYSHGDLRLLSISSADGYHASKRRDDADYIDVRFENDHGGWRVRVRVENGHVTGDVDRT